MLPLHKRGDLAIQEIVLLILALVVLVTLLYVFRTQIYEVAQRLFGITNSLETQTPLDQLLE